MSMFMRSIKRFFISFAIALAVVTLGFIFWLRDHYVPPILTYHNISYEKGAFYLNNVRPESFAWQMKFLKKHGYFVINFYDFVKGLKKGRAFARNTVVIQFDDGYADNYTDAFPVLKRYRFPATVFIVSDKVGTPGFLTWDQVKEMDTHNFTAGAHTRHHVYLPDVPLDVARDEIVGSKKMIEEHVGHPIDYFAYPSGGFNEEIEGIVEEAGFKAAVTTNRGEDRLNRDLFALKRIRIKDSDNALVLYAKLSGYYNLFRKNKDGE